MQSQTPQPNIDERPPVEPSLAQLLDMVGTAEDFDLGWFFDRKSTPEREAD